MFYSTFVAHMEHMHNTEHFWSISEISSTFIKHAWCFSSWNISLSHFSMLTSLLGSDKHIEYFLVGYVTLVVCKDMQCFCGFS